MTVEVAMKDKSIPGRTIKAIDYWCNPFTPETLCKFLEDEEVGHVIKWWGMEDKWQSKSVEQFVRMMDEANVEMAMVPNLQMRSYQRKVMITDFSVEEIAAIVRQCPSRLKGLYGINPYKKMEGVRELEAAVKEYGFIGAHLHTYGFSRAINHRDYWPYYAKCHELDIPVVMQVGHSAEAMPSDLARPVRLDDIALYFPRLRIVGAHTGWPWVEELIAMSWKHRHIYIGTSMHLPKYWDRSLVSFLNTRRGIGKVMFGSDYPGLSYDEALQQLDQIRLKEEAKKSLLRGTALKVFNLNPS
ncbi:MAG: amidohydrolase [Desulfatitalea sp.]|nr:amidohydrolase family protein [Desulfatitalea sp.]NNK01440.1 amidohydrolase [Desulfatitalea sp.]